MAIRDPSDLHEDEVAGRFAALVIGGIAAFLAICVLLVVLYAHGFPI